MINTIILGHTLNVLPKLPKESVNCVTCSPPYWGLRDYDVAPVIWDGDKKCKHKWTEGKTAGDIRFRGRGSIVGNNRNINIYPIKHRPDETNPGKESWYKDKGGLPKSPSQSSFCSLCGAWRGSLGLEPTFELYINHLCDIFDEVKRVLRKDGTCWVNIGDSYGGSGNRSGHTLETSNLNRLTIGYGATGGNQKATRGYEKSLLDIPYRFSIGMTDRGWAKRNTIIWWKPGCMPSSANDRFTVDFEYLFYFTKNSKTLFWTNEKTLECVSKKPLGIKGIEGRDWEWRPCPRCQVTGGVTKIDKEDAESMGSPRARYHRTTKQEECKRCKGLGNIKVSLWSGHDYWFEQQFENSLNPEDDVRRLVKANQYNANRQGGNSAFVGRNRNEDKTRERMARGRNKRCVWIIPTKPFPEAHFAVYPEGLIEIPVKAGCPEFVCKKCGKARVKIYKTEINPDKVPKKWRKTYRGKVELKGSPTKRSVSELYAESLAKEKTFIDYTDCGCDAGWESGIVLDPFMGAGTSALVALKQRKRFIGIEIKQEYIDMANKRIARVQQEIF